jgi:hypothetical protein
MTGDAIGVRIEKGTSMRRRALGLGVSLLMGVPFIMLAAANASPKPVEFSDARLKVEINATDGDAGLQVFLDGEAWNQVELLDPDGNVVVDVDVTGRAEDYGLTELFSESSEPPFEEFPLEQFKALFPEGTYTFRGTTIDGTPMEGTAELTHDFPDGPEILLPVAGSRLSRERVVVAWAPVTSPDRVHIVAYQVLVVQEEPVLRVFSADVPATVTRLSIPAEYVQPRTGYKVEVLAIEAGGNQTLTELTFRTR